MRTPERGITSVPRCDRPVQGDGIMSYHCSLPQGHEVDTRDPGDPQPCYAVESSRSARAWDAWKVRQEEAEARTVRQEEVIRCPGCNKVTMQIDRGEGRGLCTNCGTEAQFQPDQPEQPSQPPESIEDIEQPGEPWRTLADPESDPELSADQIEYRERIGRGYAAEIENQDSVRLPTKQREGDQRLPAGGDLPVQDWIIAQMEESKRVGVERYGQPLMTFDSRLNIRDLAEELRDAYVYISKLQMMAEADRGTLLRVVTQRMEALNGARYPLTTEQVAEAAVDAVLDWVLVQKIGPDQVRPETGE